MILNLPLCDRSGFPGWLLAGLLLALTACSDGPRFVEVLPPGTTVLAFGDSVTHGTGAGRGEGYPEQLARLSGWKVINAGIPGDTAAEARSRLTGLLAQHAPELVIVELGGNDFLRRRRADQVKADLDFILRTSLDTGAITILVAVPQLSVLRATVGALDDSPIYAELAEETGVVLVPDVFSAVLSDDTLRADRIHPNAVGYARMADGIAQRLREVGLLR